MTRPPLLLLPGILCDDAVWDGQTGALQDVADVRIAKLDGDTIGEMAEGVLAAAPEKFALAGFSMGGYVALDIIRRQPERVLRLCLANTNARADTPSQKEDRAALILLAETRGIESIAAKLTPLVLHPSRRSDTGLTSAVEAMMVRVGKDRFIQQQRAVASRCDRRSDLAAISVPTCIVRGDADAVSPSELAEEMAGAIPHVRLHTLRICGHMSPLEVPDDVTAALQDWLAMPESHLLDRTGTTHEYIS